MLGVDTPDTVLSLGETERVCIGEGGGRGIMKYLLMLYLFERMQLPFVSMGNWFQDPRRYQNPRFSNPLTVSQPFISVEVTPTDMESQLYLFGTCL